MSVRHLSISSTYYLYCDRGKEREESYTDVPVFGWKTIYFIVGFVLCILTV